MKMIIIFSLCLCAFVVQGMDRFAALSMLESGDNDNLIGPCGELSRYQISPKVAVEFDVETNRLTDPVYAFQMAWRITIYRCVNFRHDYHHFPSDYDFYLLWHCPSHVNHPNAAEADLARRFANLCQR